MISDIILPNYLNGRHFLIGKSEAPNTPGWLDLNDNDVQKIEKNFESVSPEYTNAEWCFHGSSQDAITTIFKTKTFIPQIRRGMEDNSGFYLGCRGIAEYFAIDESLRNGHIFTSEATTPALLAIKKRDLEKHYKNLFSPDSISDINPPSEILRRHNVIDLLDSCTGSSQSLKEGLIRCYAQSGTFYLKSKDPIDLSKIDITMILTHPERTSS